MKEKRGKALAGASSSLRTTEPTAKIRDLHHFISQGRGSAKCDIALFLREGTRASRWILFFSSDRPMTGAWAA
jgi:hypothetical protein